MNITQKDWIDFLSFAGKKCLLVTYVEGHNKYKAECHDKKCPACTNVNSLEERLKSKFLKGVLCIKLIVEFFSRSNYNSQNFKTLLLLSFKQFMLYPETIGPVLINL